MATRPPTPKLELLASPPGTGKTTYCIDLFRNEILKTKGGIDSRSYFILPSREHAERIQNLVLKKEAVGEGGLFNAHILTINDFTSRLLGAALTRRPGEALRHQVLKAVLEEKAPELKYFGPALGFTGFRHLFLDAIKEFKSGLFSMQEFERLSQRLLKRPAFRLKFKDFSIVFKNYEKRLKDIGFSEAEEDIEALLALEPVGSELILLDGFYHFTRAQERLIQYLARHAGRVVVTLTLPEDAGRRALFEYPQRTLRFLSKAGFRQAKGLPSQSRRTVDTALAHLEKNLFLEHPLRYERPQQSVNIFAASNARVEVEMIARQIKALYRESALHFSDICVILRSIGPYETIIESVFADLGVPVHVHERKKLIENGLALALHKLLNLTQENWMREDVFFLLRSSYFCSPEERDAAHTLESLAAAANILEGKEAWQKFAVSAEAAALPAAAALSRMLSLDDVLQGARSAPALTAALMAALGRIQVIPGDKADEEALRCLQALLRSAGDYHTDAKTRRFDGQAFMKGLQESLEQALFSLKPQGRNRVQVYDVVMALPKEYKVVFMAGLLEKGFPQEVTEDALFKDVERREMNKRGVVLDERRWRFSGERYFFYMGVSRARERLYLTAPLYDMEGRPCLTSFFVEEVRKCFKEIPEIKKDLEDFLPGPREWCSESEVTQGLADTLFQPERAPSQAGQMLPVLNAWLTRPDFREVLANAAAGSSAGLSDAGAKKLFAEFRSFSATRLEIYANCAFKYFAGRVLSLVEPPEGSGPREIGDLLHRTLEEFYKELPTETRESPLLWRDTERIKKVLMEKFESILKQGTLARQPLYRQKMLGERMRRTLSLFVQREKALAEKRNLVPTHFELTFGRGATGALPPLVIPSPLGDIRIEGQIDRVDRVRDADQALVVDYKKSSASRKDSLSVKIEKGLELQLPIYMLAVKRLLGLDPVGAELRFLENSNEQGIYGEHSPEALKAGKRRLYSRVEIDALLARSESLIATYVGRLRKADIAVDSKSCDYCRFDSVCRFEKWKLIYSESATETGP